MRLKMRIMALALACTMMVTSVYVPASAAKKVTVKKITVASSLSGDKKTVYVAKGKKVKLKTTVSVTPNKKANKGVTFKSSNKKVATVNGKGIVKGKKTGTAKITVRSKKNKKKKASITVKVMKTAVSKIKIGKTEASLNAGESLTLKAKVTAGKAACKKVAWTSSNKKVATVTKKGVVQAKSAGTATITVKAIDGSGKKASCKVTVNDSVVTNNLVSMDIVNPQTVTFTLEKAQQLSKEQVCIKTKENSTGQYNNTLEIENLTTADSVNYTVTVSSEKRIEEMNYVQLAVSGLADDVKVLEKQYVLAPVSYTDEVVSVWEKDVLRDKTFSFSEGKGHIEYSITGLPAGLVAKTQNKSLLVEGEPQETGIFKAVMKAVDEYGNTLTKNINFVIGSEQILVAGGVPTYSLNNKDSDKIRATVYVSGGSGSYSCEIIDDSQNAEASIYDSPTASCDNLSITSKITEPGDYTVRVRITDKKNPSISCEADLVMHVIQGITIGGIIKDAEGNAMKQGVIEVINKNPYDPYFSDGEVDTSDTGSYSMIVAPGTYDIKASQDVSSEAGKASVYLYNQNITAVTSSLDFTLPVYKVTFTGDGDIKYLGWYIDHSYIGTGSSVYVKPGSYLITSATKQEQKASEKTENGDWFNGYSYTVVTTYSRYHYTMNVNVVNTAVQVPLTKSDLPPETQTSSATYPAAKNTIYSVSELGKEYNLANTDDRSTGRDYNAYSFVPTVTGTYMITTSYTGIYLYDQNGNKMTGTDNQYALTAGQKYYIGTGNIYNANKIFSVTQVN